MKKKIMYTAKSIFDFKCEVKTHMLGLTCAAGGDVSIYSNRGAHSIWHNGAR
jgi:hypothetical protein